MVTVTSTVFETVSRLATQVATVMVAEVSTSTIVSTVEVTVTDAAVQTDVVWVTTTAVAKRGVPTSQPELIQERVAAISERSPLPPLPGVLDALGEAWDILRARGFSTGAKLNHFVADIAPGTSSKLRRRLNYNSHCHPDDWHRERHFHHCDGDNHLGCANYHLPDNHPCPEREVDCQP